MITTTTPPVLMEIRESVNYKFLAWYEEAVYIGRSMMLHLLCPEHAHDNETPVMFLQKRQRFAFDIQYAYHIFMSLSLVYETYFLLCQKQLAWLLFDSGDNYPEPRRTYYNRNHKTVW